VVRIRRFEAANSVAAVARGRDVVTQGAGDVDAVVCVDGVSSRRTGLRQHSFVELGRSRSVSTTPGQVVVPCKCLDIAWLIGERSIVQRFGASVVAGAHRSRGSTQRHSKIAWHSAAWPFFGGAARFELRQLRNVHYRRGAALPEADDAAAAPGKRPMNARSSWSGTCGLGAASMAAASHRDPIPAEVVAGVAAPDRARSRGVGANEGRPSTDHEMVTLSLRTSR